MDLLRGVGVVLVAVRHVVTVPELFGAVVPTWLRSVLTGLTPYRIPLLLAIATSRRAVVSPAAVAS